MHARSLLLLVVVVAGGCPRPTPLPAEPPPPVQCDDSGKTVQRLNRSEYDHTVKDLLGVSSTLASTFPADDAVGGFDNNADILSISPLLVERYAAAADDAAAAFDDAGVGPGWVRYGAACADVSCVDAFLRVFLRDAFRRAVDDDDVARYHAVVVAALDDGDSFAAAVRAAVAAALLSPSFLFRVETDVDGALDAWSLASRLSYLVWSSMPDAALLARAEDGTLSDPAVLDAELRRLLDDDDKVRGGLVEGLAGQWLSARTLDRAAPDPPLSNALRDGMSQETRRVVAELLQTHRPARDLLDAEFTWVNEPLADLYGAAFDAADDDDGDGFVRVEGIGRAGILGHAAFLTSTSFPERTSPVKRGFYVVDRLLCMPPDNPPDDVPPLDETVVDGSLRERMAAHRASPDCAGCHAIMDPIGFGLEGYGPIGAARVVDEGGYAIDDDDAFFEQPFHDPSELAQVIKNDPELDRCFVTEIATYALGRGVDGYGADACVIDAIVAAAEDDGFALADIVAAVVASDAFRRRAPAPAGAE